MAGIAHEVGTLKASDGPDLDALKIEVEDIQRAVAAAENAAIDAETAHAAARKALEAMRTPLTEAERRVQRLETEA